MKKNWTGERLEEIVIGEFVSEHLHRYALASMFVDGKIVLDIASGEGYGSNILSNTATEVYGVDIDEGTIELASKKYVKNNLFFLRGSADNIPLQDNSVDVVVSFETIEHHDKHDEMLSEIKRVLKKDGILIISSPDKKYHSDLSGKNNPFHIKELYLDEFETLIKRNFNEYKIYFQRYVDNCSVIGERNDFQQFKVFTGYYDIIQKMNLWPLYNIAIASDNPVEKVDLFMFDGTKISQRLISEKENFVRTSTTFKVGKIILSPFLKIKKIIKL